MSLNGSSAITRCHASSDRTAGRRRETERGVEQGRDSGDDGVFFPVRRQDHVAALNVRGDVAEAGLGQHAAQRLHLDELVAANVDAAKQHDVDALGHTSRNGF